MEDLVSNANVFIFSSHSIDAVKKYCNRYARMHNGELIEISSRRNLVIEGNTILKSIFSITLVGILLGGHTYKPSIEQFLIGFSDAIYLGSAHSIAGFILIFTICNVLLIPTLMLNLLAGYFWGTFGGGAIVTIAITIGGTICFTLSRGTGGSALAQKIQKKN